ncbi:hypothetical protein amb3560 [Paramagnetospirillum magneticum AMB-1]|uniref:Uncharacterized protein n=1 Tax=Paramagnetospirillum magneticum (strain ATCC 700264 / AMB-1) TaxID=342108 RepID=Q2W1B1_PARM1|nr:hypothetical protein amb3560 [Paramagnetospirillum magneticum AMB-1]
MPVRLRRVASGLMIDRVRSMAIGEFLSAVARAAPGVGSGRPRTTPGAAGRIRGRRVITSLNEESNGLYKPAFAERAPPCY